MGSLGGGNKGLGFGFRVCWGTEFRGYGRGLEARLFGIRDYGAGGGRSGRIGTLGLGTGELMMYQKIPGAALSERPTSFSYINRSYEICLFLKQS